MNDLMEACLRLLFPPKCAACQELLEADEVHLCHSCALAYEEAITRACPECLKPMRECTCPNRFLDRHGVHQVAKLYAYHPRESALPTNRLIYRLKKAESHGVVSFLAQELIRSIKPLMDASYPYVIVGAPRSKPAIRTYGYDHVKLLCQEIAKKMGIPYVPAVKRVGNSGPQKKKNHTERLQAAVGSYVPAPGIDLHGKRVILVDDVVTSGATLAACAAAVRKTGARTVIGAVIGSSYRYQDLVGAKKYYFERRKYFVGSAK